MRDLANPILLITGVLIVLLVLAGSIVGGYWLKHRLAYSWSYRGMVKDTVREVIREEYKLIICYEQDDRKWGVSRKGKMMFVIDSDEVECPESFGRHIVDLLNANEEGRE